jgi:SAM-dependent methyltransferase
MPEPLQLALADVRERLLDPAGLVRAVASGRRRGASPSWRRAELRPVDLRAGRRLQVVTYDDRQAHTRNLAYDDALAAKLAPLVEEPFGSWHLETTTETVQLRVTKKGQAQVHRTAVARAQASGTVHQETARRDKVGHDKVGHDRVKARLLDPADPLFDVLGGGADKRRQVEAFLRALDPLVDDALPRSQAPAAQPLRVVDLGCGNAYLTFAAYRFLTVAHGRDVRVVGVDLRPQARAHNTELAQRLGWAGHVTFREGAIYSASDGDATSALVEDATGAGADIVLALHACDTATDEALARAVRWRAPLVLAAPCCHHDVQRQLRAVDPPAAYGLITRHGILRERLGDVLTDALRAALLRLLGYRVDVVEFVGSEHTARNVLLRAVRTGAAPTPALVAQYQQLTAAWGLQPHLAGLLGAELADVLG